MSNDERTKLLGSLGMISGKGDRVVSSPAARADIADAKEAQERIDAFDVIAVDHTGETYNLASDDPTGSELMADNERLEEENTRLKDENIRLTAALVEARKLVRILQGGDES